MSSDAPPPLADNRVILGCGSVTVDFLAAVASYPKPGDKIRTTSAKVQGGGNAGNALTCAARLGLKPRLISKVADDSQGQRILEELEADGVDSSFVMVSKGGRSPFTYVIVDNQTKTRTCVFTSGYPPMIPSDLTKSKLLAALDGARLVYFDGRLHETALVVAREAACKENVQSEEVDVDDLLYTLKNKMSNDTTSPICVSSSEVKLCAKGIGTVWGKLLLGTAEKIPPSELVDTTGAGDSFIGAVLYALCANMPPEKMLRFAAQVAAIGCRALGARTGLPHGTDPHLSSFLL